MGFRLSMRKLFSLPLGKLDLQNKQLIKFPFFRVPLIVSKTPRRFKFGFASNMALLLWCVCGGLLLHMLEANYLSILLKPNYEKPIDTAQDVFDRNLKIIFPPYRESSVEFLKNSPFAVNRALAKMTVVAKVILIFYT